MAIDVERRSQFGLGFWRRISLQLLFMAVVASAAALVLVAIDQDGFLNGLIILLASFLIAVSCNKTKDERATAASGMIIAGWLATWLTMEAFGYI